MFTHPDYDLTGLGSSGQVGAERPPRPPSGPCGGAFVSGPITLKQPEGEILQVLADSSSKPVTPPKDGDLQKFAYTDFGTATPVVEKKIAALDVTQVRFGNNVRLNLKQTKFDANSILVAIRFGGGRLDLPRDKPGLKLLADQTFVSGGLQQHNVDDLGRLTAGRNEQRLFPVVDAFVLTGRTTPADLLLQLQMMAAYITAPGYRPEALDRFHQGLGSLYLNLTRTPGGVMQSQVSRFLHDGDPRFGVPDQDDAAKRTLDELKAWLAEPLATSYMEVSIVGDFDPSGVEGGEFDLGAWRRARSQTSVCRTAQGPLSSERTLKTFTFDA